MNRKSLVILLVLVCNGLSAQVQIPNTVIWNTVDKVGINNATPNATLDVLGKAKFRGLSAGKISIDESLAALLVGPNQTRRGTIGSYYPGIGFNHLLTYSNTSTVHWDNQMHAWIGTRLIATPHSELSALVFATTSTTGNPGTQFPTEKMVVMPDGKIGVNTKSPTGILHLKMQTNHTTEGFTLESHNGNSKWYILPEATSGVNYGDRSLLFYSDQTGYIMSLNGNGNVGIGINHPQNKLEVNGTIRAKEIKVDANGWADYVFEDGYKLRPLNEVEVFVKTNKHLPEIPSAKQMEADGVNVAEMNKLLLQKVEELMLYTIEQEKKLSNKDIELEELKMRMSKIESLIKNQ